MWRRLFLTAGAVMLLCLPALSQGTGQIIGVVRDSSGSVVPGATVKATESATGLARTTTSGSNGQYVLPSLRPTRYDITVESQGFRAFQRTGVELLANQSLTVPVTLELGTVTETVTVVGSAVQVNTTTSTLSEVVDQARIVDLPLNGRDVARLTSLVAGTSIISISGETGKSIPGGLRLSSNGSVQGQVAYRLDGASNTDFYFQENQTFPSPDFVQEFSIQTSNYSAVHGNNAGAVVNVMTRSGTNEFHGGAFEFVRNRSLNARNTFAKEADFLKRNQFGAFAGGPALLPGYNGRNRTFFFAGWQATRLRNRANDVTAFAPTDAQRRGDFGNQRIRDPLATGACSASDQTACFPGNKIPEQRFDPASSNLLGHIPAVGSDSRLVFGRNIAQEFDQGVAKVDHQFSTKDRLSGRYFIDHFRNAAIYNDGNLLTYRGGSNQSRVRTQNSVLTWSHTFGPALLNEFHFGYNRVHSRRAPPSGVPSMGDLGVRLPLSSSKPGIQQIEVSGFFNIGDNQEASFVRNGFEWSERLSWIKGRHSMTFGGEIARYRVDIDNEFRRPGNYVFRANGTGHAMADFLIGRVDSFDHGTGEYKDNRATYMSLFFQDDFKVHPRFTLNLGVRWEPTPPWHEVNGRIQVFRVADFAAGRHSPQFDQAPPGVFFRGDPGVPEDGTAHDKNNIGARLGFAWDVLGDGKTSVRGGAGMFYDQHMLGEFNNGAVNAAPWNIRLSLARPNDAIGPFSDPYRGRNDFNLVALENIGKKDTPFPRPVLLTSYDDRFDTPISYNWNLAVEREVSPEWLARLAYVGSASNYGRNTKQLNAAPFIPGSSASRPRIFGDEIGSVEYFTQDRRSYYHSMQASLTKRLSHGFTVLANYTWSKSLGNYPGSGAAANAGEVAPWFVPGADSYLYGPSDFDQRQRFVVSWVWDIPRLATANSFARAILHGWQWTGISQYQTGSPYTVTSGRNNSGTTLNRDRAKLTGVSPAPPAGSDKRVWFNPAAFAVNDPGTFGNVGRGAFYGPGLYSWDMGMFKSTRLTERTSLQFRAEFFNIFNQTNFNNPNTNRSGGGFGTLTGAGDPRIIQFGLKLLF